MPFPPFADAQVSRGHCSNARHQGAESSRCREVTGHRWWCRWEWPEGRAKCIRGQRKRIVRTTTIGQDCSLCRGCSANPLAVVEGSASAIDCGRTSTGEAKQASHVGRVCLYIQAVGASGQLWLVRFEQLEELRHSVGVGRIQVKIYLNIFLHKCFLTKQNVPPQPPQPPPLQSQTRFAQPTTEAGTIASHRPDADVSRAITVLRTVHTNPSGLPNRGHRQHNPIDRSH